MNGAVTRSLSPNQSGITSGSCMAPAAILLIPLISSAAISSLIGPIPPSTPVAPLF